MGTYTTNYNLYKPTVGEQGWGSLINTNFDTTDSTMHGLRVDTDSLISTRAFIDNVTLTGPLETTEEILTIADSKTILAFLLKVTVGPNKNFKHIVIRDANNVNIIEPFDVNTSQTGQKSSFTQVYSNYSGSNKTIYIDTYDYVWNTGSAYPYVIASYGMFGTDYSSTVLVNGISNGSYPTNAMTYNGTTWSAYCGTIVGRSNVSACGNKTSGLVTDGINQTTYNNTTYKSNGSAWSTGTSTSTYNIHAGMVGINNTTVLRFGGYNGSPTPIVYNTCQNFDGTTWATTGNMPVGKYQFQSFGIQSAAICAGGVTTSANTNTCYKFDGSTWSVIQSVPVTSCTSGMGCGIQSNGLITGQAPNIGDGANVYDNMFNFNGSTWSTSIVKLSIPRISNNAGGSASNTITTGGVLYAAGHTNITEYRVQSQFSGTFQMKIVTI